MKDNNKRFLGHLDGVIPRNARNYMLSTYSIILEAWRRGLDINIRIVLEGSGNIEPYYSISDGNKTHHFSTTRGDFVSREAIDLTKNKQSAKEYLINGNVPTPLGKDFNKDIQDINVIEYAEDIGFPVVVKPLSGTGGKGVIANIKDKKDLEEALNYVRVKLNSPHIILEKYFKGEDYRLYVLGDKIVGAIKRIRANVKGDGKHTIKELVSIKNKERQMLPALSNRPIKLDSETDMLLHKIGYNLNSVPREGEIVYLKSKNNVSAGGDSIDVTDQISDNLKQIAIDATKCFPSLQQAGVDLMINENNDTGVVIEINTRAHITQHLFPMEGQARDIPSHIIDYYFPETKNHKQDETHQLYIDYDFIFNASLSRIARDITLPRISNSPIVLKRHVISNCPYSSKLAKRIRRRAFNNNVHGYIKPLRNGDIVVVTGGNAQRVEKFITQITNTFKKVTKKVEIMEKNRTSPIKHGFHIEGYGEIESKNDMNALNNPDVYIEKYSNLKKDYQNLVHKLAEFEKKESIMKVTQKQNRKLKSKLKQLESSTSWKVTKPIRKVSKLLKSK